MARHHSILCSVEQTGADAMSRHSTKRKQRALNRAAPSSLPGGALMYLSPQQLQSVLGQTFYGSKAGIPTGATTLFSPGLPLPAQPGVNPQGQPTQFRFPVSYNTYPVDRTLGNPDIPSFEVLRRMARMYSGITLCERAWMDMVPRMGLKISLRPEVIAQGAEEKAYQREIAFFFNFFSKPDGQHDLHTWLRMALREQTQIDELYLYKHKTRGGKLLGLQIVAGDQMKPLLDDWGRQPDPPGFAFQQYPWGIPGMQYRIDQMVHYQESPAADTPYGFSRVERFILEVNQALRKKKKDLSYFTEGNIPQAFMEVPEASTWSQDQIQAYEDAWNSLLAGNGQQQVRMKFMQPGMKYVAAEQYTLATDFDRFLFYIACGVYGRQPSEFGFTETTNRATAEVEEDVIYRRTIGPIAADYGHLLTRCMEEDFPPELHGDLLQVTFTGYEEEEDVATLATAYSTLTSAGILGISNAGKLMKLPEDPDAPHIGRVIVQKGAPPVFLDDMADPAVRAAQKQATLAGFQMATQPPAQAQQPGNDEEEEGDGASQAGRGRAGAKPKAAAGQARTPNSTQQQPGTTTSQQRRSLEGLFRHIEAWLAEERREEHDDEPGASQPGEAAQIDRQYDDGGAGRGDRGDGARTARTDAARAGAEGLDQATATSAISAEYRRWRGRAIDDVKAGRTLRGFTTTLIPEGVHKRISDELAECSTPDEVRAVFARAKQAPQDSELIGAQPLLEYDPAQDIWQPEDVEQQLAAFRAQGVTHLVWRAHASESGICPVCEPNDGLMRAVGEAWPSGHRLPQCHPNCQCSVEPVVVQEMEQAS
jgi:hypothetical protein